MRVYRGFDDIPRFEAGAVATVGSFDGVHRGHTVLLAELSEISKRNSIPSVVLTFEPHPRVILGRADGLKLLTSLEEKVSILEQMGIDILIVINFDREFSRLPYDRFITQYLIERVGISHLVVGYNHQIGRNSEGSYSSLVKLGDRVGLTLHQVKEWSADAASFGTQQMQSVSSTVIRNMLQRGEIASAATLLNRAYMICGRTDRDGRVWCSESLKLIPAEGRYRAIVNGEESLVEIDSNGVMTSTRANEEVVIEMLVDQELL